MGKFKKNLTLKLRTISVGKLQKLGNNDHNCDANNSILWPPTAFCLANIVFDSLSQDFASGTIFVAKYSIVLPWMLSFKTGSSQLRSNIIFEFAF